MRLRCRGKRLAADSGDTGKVDAVPVHRRGWCDAVIAAVETGAEVDDDGIGMSADERAHPVVEHLGAQRRLAHDAGLYPKAREVVVDLSDHLVGQRVTQDRSRPPAVQRSRIFGEKRGLLDR